MGYSPGTGYPNLCLIPDRTRYVEIFTSPLKHNQLFKIKIHIEQVFFKLNYVKFNYNGCIWRFALTFTILNFIIFTRYVTHCPVCCIVVWCGLGATECCGWTWWSQERNVYEFNEGMIVDITRVWDVEPKAHDVMICGRSE